MSTALAEPPPPPRMTVAEFLRWLESAPEGERYELDYGQPFAMAADHAGHSRAKFATCLALREATRHLPCEAFVDGLLVPIADDRAYQPDALLRCGEPLPPDARFAEDPVVVVEIVSPGGGFREESRKLDGYFRLPSLRHYVILDPAERRAIHFRRPGPEGVIETLLLGAGATIPLDPPGVALELDALFG